MGIRSHDHSPVIFGNDVLEYRREDSQVLHLRPVRILIGLCGVLVVTFLGYRVVPVNATTVGFAFPLQAKAPASSFLFRFVVKPKVSSMLLHQFDFRSVINHLPLLRFVEHSSQCL